MLPYHEDVSPETDDELSNGSGGDQNGSSQPSDCAKLHQAFQKVGKQFHKDDLCDSNLSSSARFEYVSMEHAFQRIILSPFASSFLKIASPSQPSQKGSAAARLLAQSVNHKSHLLLRTWKKTTQSQTLTRCQWMPQQRRSNAK